MRDESRPSVNITVKVGVRHGVSNCGACRGVHLPMKRRASIFLSMEEHRFGRKDELDSLARILSRNHVTNLTFLLVLSCKMCKDCTHPRACVWHATTTVRSPWPLSPFATRPHRT